MTRRSADPGDQSGPPKARATSDDALMREGFRQAPFALAIHDIDLRLVWVNEAMERRTGRTEDELRGRLPSEVVEASEAADLELEMRLALENGAPRRLEGFPTDDQGQAYDQAILLTPLRGPAGRIGGICLAVRDTPEWSGREEARRRLLLLNKASAQVGSTLNIRRTAQELADVLVPALADFTSVSLLASLELGDEPPSGPLNGPVTLRRVANRSVTEGEALVGLGEMATYPESTPIARCLATGSPMIYPLDDAALSRWAVYDPKRAERIRAMGTHSAMVVPLIARNVTLGAAMITRHRRPGPFEPDDMLLAEEVSARAAVCIDNARRYTRERNTAVALQQSLLPQKVVNQAVLETAFRYLPAGGRSGVGGDWFDVIPLSGARVALVVGDVVGHGVQAAAAMGRLRSAVRMLADIDYPPDELLTRLDDLVISLSAETLQGTDSAGATGFEATCLYAVYDSASQQCVFARAGHPPPLLVTPDGRVQTVDVPVGLPLGLGGHPFESAELTLPVGSLLAFYTDGLIDERDRDPEDGLRRFGEALTVPALPLGGLCDSVVKDLVSAHPADDVALLLARTRGLDADRVATWDLAADPAIVKEARKAVLAQLSTWNLEEAALVAELVVSELVTNAIRYGEAPIQLRLIYERTLTCEVSDASSTAPRMRRVRTFDEGGRGLLLVAQLTQRWGARYSRSGKTIWAEQSLGADQENSW